MQFKVDFSRFCSQTLNMNFFMLSCYRNVSSLTMFHVHVDQISFHELLQINEYDSCRTRLLFSCRSPQDRPLKINSKLSLENFAAHVMSVWKIWSCNFWKFCLVETIIWVCSLGILCTRTWISHPFFCHFVRKCTRPLEIKFITLCSVLLEIRFLSDVVRRILRYVRTHCSTNTYIHVPVENIFFQI